MLVYGVRFETRELFARYSLIYNLCAFVLFLIIDLYILNLAVKIQALFRKFGNVVGYHAEILVFSFWVLHWSFKLDY